MNLSRRFRGSVIWRLSTTAMVPDMLKCGTTGAEIQSVFGLPSACNSTNRTQVPACFNKVSPSL